MISTWIRALLLESLTLLLLCFRALPTAAQPGFISIDCGSASQKNYTSNSGIKWSNDDNYILGGYDSGPVWTWQGDWAEQLHSFRYFNESRSKFCYGLPVEVNKTYLVRAGFLWGNFSDLSEGPISFDLTVFSSLWKTVEVSAVTDFRSDLKDGVTSPLTAETIVRSTSSVMNVCLVRKTGNPFINSLELRPMDDDMYVDVFKNKLLVNHWRWTAGRCCLSSPRYPDDPYDRIWYQYGDKLSSGNVQVEDQVVIENFNRNQDLVENQTVLAPMTTFNRPPVQVMMDAWAFGKSVVMHFPIDGKSSEYYMALYFQELNGTSGLRKFSLLLNGELLQEISPQANGFGFIAVKSISGTFANFTLQSAPSSVSNPILNGIEMYGLLDVNSSSTDPDDVRFLNAIRARLGLVESIGDPCFPVPWGWLSCSHLQPSRVTQLKLSNSGLGGSIPLELVSLTELTDLWLDSNNFKGLIPNFSSLQKIRTIYLQNNNLTGPIPSNLSELPLLQELFLDNNTLYGVVPQSLLALDSSNDRNFTFTFSGNLLCLPGNKTCEENSPGSGSSTSNSSSFNKGLIFGPSVGGLAVLMAIIAAVLMYYRRGMKETTAQTANSKKEYTKQALDMGQTNQARPYTYEEIERITCNFHNVLGAGSFGPVYHGKLSSGQEVAVKVNAANSNQGQAEFVNEVVLLSRVHHKYLVSLVGYCEDSNQQILIYVYMPNGSLGDHLHHKKPGKKPLSWRKRLEIALNAAQGLDYLHTFCSPPIIHRDVKPNNILLDENLNAKVADFGMSKSEFEGSQTGISTAVKGTLGYLDPEYSSGRQRLNQKSDVYSFGVVLLELITGKKPTSSQPVDGGSDIHMIEWTRLVKTHGDISVIIDPAMGSDYKVEAVWKLAELGWTSISERGADRPDMGRIVQGLVEAIQIEGTNVIQNLVKPKIKKVAFEDESTESTEAPLRTHSMNTVATWDSKNSSAYNPR